MATAQRLWTVNAIKDAARAAGSHWFDPDAIRFFGTRVLPTVYQGPGGVYFVTSEQPPHGPRMHTVRRFDPATAGVATVGELAGLTRGQAVARAREEAAGSAAGGATETAEPFRPVSVLEQFRADLAAHGNPATATADNAGQLVALADAAEETEMKEAAQILAEPLYCEGVHGVTGRGYEEGTLESGALIRGVEVWDEGAICDPGRDALPAWAEPEMVTFLASTDGGQTWFRQRSRNAPVCHSADAAECPYCQAVNAGVRTGVAHRCSRCGEQFQAADAAGEN